jgi:hypothetical protein
MCPGKYYLFTVDMSGTLHRKLSIWGQRRGARKWILCEVVGGWIEGDERVKAIVLARIKIVKNFFKTSESYSGLAA